MASDMDEPARPSELVTFGQVMKMLGVGRSRAQAITVERRFPVP
ncbi:hypothetical protein [Frankia nepalensis]|nr:hypothetical protein [Frankia nepalensis]